MYVEDEQEWEVSVIFRHKGAATKRNYLVSYAGYDEYEAFKLPESDLILLWILLLIKKLPMG